MPKSNTKLIQSTSQYWYGLPSQNFEGVLFVVKHAQSTGSLKKQIKILSYLCKSATKMNQ